MSRIYPTHRLSATREGELSCSGDGDCPPSATCGPDGVCVDGYGTPVTGEQDIVGGTAGEPIPVRFHVDGVDLVRETTGETVERSPAVEGRGDLSLAIEEGDVLMLESIIENHEDYPSLEAQSVVEVYGRRARPQKTIVRTEDI